MVDDRTGIEAFCRTEIGISKKYLDAGLFF
jgi:hypothetical protein